MGFFISGVSECPICGGVLNKGDALFSTWGTFTAQLELFLFCGATMHWSCYADWPLRREFARAYFDFWVGAAAYDRFWTKVYLDDRVLVEVNLRNGRSGEAILVLAETGSRVRVCLKEWAQWLDAPETSEGERLYPLVIEELRKVTPALKAALPTVAAIKRAVGAAGKGRKGGG